MTEKWHLSMITSSKYFTNVFMGSAQKYTAISLWPTTSTINGQSNAKMCLAITELIFTTLHRQ